jgi:outer membrane immunogenic protein
MTMKSNIVRGVALASAVAFATNASADGMPRGSLKDSPGAVPYNWTGFYVGANVGYAWSDADFGITPTGLWSIGPASAASIVSTTNGMVVSDGFTGGVQAGYNRQIGNFVWGVEADINRVDNDETRVRGAIPVTAIVSFSQRADLDWSGSLRARLGIASDRLLIYATGGLAFGHWETRMNMTTLGVDAAYSNSGWETGWVLGGGLEYAFADRWTLRGEYLFADYGHVTGSSEFPRPVAPNFTHTHNVDLTTQTARVGVNYRF